MWAGAPTVMIGATRHRVPGPTRRLNEPAEPPSGAAGVSAGAPSGSACQSARARSRRRSPASPRRCGSARPTCQPALRARPDRTRSRSPSRRARAVRSWPRRCRRVRSSRRSRHEGATSRSERIVSARRIGSSPGRLVPGPRDELRHERRDRPLAQHAAPHPCGVRGVVEQSGRATVPQRRQHGCERDAPRPSGHGHECQRDWQPATAHGVGERQTGIGVPGRDEADGLDGRHPAQLAYERRRGAGRGPRARPTGARRRPAPTPRGSTRSSAPGRPWRRGDGRATPPTSRRWRAGARVTPRNGGGCA